MRCAITSNIEFKFQAVNVNDVAFQKIYLKIVYVFGLNFLPTRLPYKYRNAIRKAWIFRFRK